MKKTIALIVAAIIGTIAAIAAGPQMKFETTSHDFGTIHADGGKVSCEYTFTNTGTEPLVIISVSNGGCGCTKPSFPKKPIEPGKTGTIKITFNPAGRKGEFNRTVKVRSNAEQKRESLRFSGVIVP